MPMNRRTLVAFLATTLLATSFSQAADMETQDVVVVGSGIAGCAAALSALEFGAHKVLMIERARLIGGHSLMSSGTLAVVSPKRQVPLGIKDSVDLLWQDSRLVGGPRANEKMIRTIGEQSEKTVDWLEREGVEFSPVVFQSGGGLHPRCVAGKSTSAGKDYVLTLYGNAKKLGLVTLLNTRLTGFRESENGWIVECSQNGADVEIKTKTLVLATGGFTDNPEMRKRFNKLIPTELQTSSNLNGGYFPYAQGDGIILAAKTGAKTADLDAIQLMPLSGGRIVDYVGGDIFINLDGKRFVNEDASWKNLERALLSQKGHEMWVITDSKSTKSIHVASKLADGTIKKSDDVDSMARAMGIPTAVLKKTFSDYNKAASGQEADALGKKVFTQTIDTPPYYWGKERLHVHMTLGGIVIDQNGSVLSVNDKPIRGLFAAGETTGGIFGEDRLGGMSLMSALVFGRLAGMNAAHDSQSSSKGLPHLPSRGM